MQDIKEIAEPEKTHKINSDKSIKVITEVKHVTDQKHYNPMTKN